MQSENVAKLKKITRVSKGLRASCTGFLWLILLQFVTAAVALLFHRGTGVGYFDVWYQVGDLPLGHRLLVLGMSALASAVMFKCLFHLRQLFGNYSRGEIFTRESVRQLNQFGITCVLWGVTKLLWVGLWLALSAHRPNPFQVRADSIAIGVVIVVVAWFMEMAVEMREENELTV